jgi:predicted transcriptional regulator
MKYNEIEVLDDDDYAFINMLKDVGVPKIVATTIAYLMNVDETSSREIELCTGLRQPEVSLAINKMRTEHWISTRVEHKLVGKGRPVKIFSLSVSVDDIVNHYETEIDKESRELRKSIDLVKARIKNRKT